MGKRDSRRQRTAHDGTDPDIFFGESRRKQSTRKDRQLCGQVQQAIGLALAAELDDELLNELWVVRVEPAPTVSQLLVWVSGPLGTRADEITQRLYAVAPVLRREVAASISRKRVPTLSFAVCEQEVEP